MASSARRDCFGSQETNDTVLQTGSVSMEPGGAFLKIHESIESLAACGMNSSPRQFKKNG
jgi:hypothetical protein